MCGMGRAAVWWCACVLLATVSQGESLPLCAAQLERKGSAVVSWADGAVDLRFDDPAWDSGVRIKPPPGRSHWDLSQGRVLAADVTNLSRERQLRLTLHIASGTREDKSYREVNGGLALNPGETRTLRLRLPHRSVYGVPEGVRGPRVLDTEKVLWIEAYMQWPFEAAAPGLLHARIANVRTEGAPDRPSAVPRPEAFFPFVDDFGQYAHGQWPEKVQSAAELPVRRADEERALAASARPPEWDRFGGWANGPKLEATGSFRTQKYQGKWFLVDPDGRLFFSFGLDVLQAHTDAVRAKGHEAWFKSPCPGDGVLDFNDRNLRLKYGRDDYEEAFYATLAKRLESWGFNTIGNWGSSKLMALGRTAYTMQLSDYNARLPRLAGSKLKFYDVFDPRYAQAMRTLVDDAAARDPQVARSLSDPFCIGYFIDNELNFGNRGRQMFGDDVLRCPAGQAAKRAFLDDLKAKYGDVARLNAAWKTSHADWEALARSTSVPSGALYKADSDAFFRCAVDQYFRLCREAVKSRAPNRLYLGCRFVATDAVRPAFFEPSRKYCDVLSVNIYAHSAANFGGAGFPDMPVLIGEFHFGVFDRGLFSAGLCPAGLTQSERALAFTRFLQGALVHPNVVGAHWFQFRDQPLTGRWDGEGYAIGFTDVADTPYSEMTRAAREVCENLYRYRLRGALTNDLK